jgi:hypothetical protein
VGVVVALMPDPLTPEYLGPEYRGPGAVGPAVPVGRRASVSYGQLLDRAAERLAAATDDLARIEVRSVPAPGARARAPAWLVEILDARAIAYRAAARNVMLLAPPDDPVWSTFAARLQRGAAALGLDPNADVTNVDVANAGAMSDGAGARVHEAADHLAVAADLLSTHLPPGIAPRTPQGWALRNGTGFVGAMAAVVGQVERLGRLDDQLRRVAAECGLPSTTVGQVDQADVSDVFADARLHGSEWNLAYGLEPAPATAWPQLSVESAADARHAVAMVRIWMWQYPAQVQLAHLRACAEVAETAIAVASGSASAPALSRLGGYWRRVVLAVDEMRGLPAQAEGTAALATLASVGQWLRGGGAHEALPLTKEFVELAVAAHRGQLSILSRKDAYVRDTTLRRRGPISSALSVWRPASPSDDPMRRLASALRAVVRDGEPPPLGRSSPALRAFRGRSLPADPAALAAGVPVASPLAGPAGPTLPTLGRLSDPARSHRSR